MLPHSTSPTPSLRLNHQTQPLLLLPWPRNFSGTPCSPWLQLGASIGDQLVCSTVVTEAAVAFSIEVVAVPGVALSIEEVKLPALAAFSVEEVPLPPPAEL